MPKQISLKERGVVSGREWWKHDRGEFVVLDCTKCCFLLIKGFGGRTVEIVRTIGKFHATTQQQGFRVRLLLERDLHNNKQQQTIAKTSPSRRRTLTGGVTPKDYTAA